jgi:CHASE2 domain-containing sensor protein
MAWGTQDYWQGNWDGQRAARYADQQAARLERLRESTSRLFADGLATFLKRAAVELIAVPLVLGLVAGSVAWFLHADYQRPALVAAGLSFALMLAFVVFTLSVYLVVRFLPLVVLTVVGIAGLQAAGIVPRFW